MDAAAPVEGRERPAGMPSGRASARGAWELPAVWALLALFVVLTFVTYSRLPPADLYRVSREGLAGGASRALVELNYPTALAAIPILGLCAAFLRRPRAYALAALGVLLCAGVPFTVDPHDLDARAINVIPAVGVVIAAGLTGWALRRRAVVRPRRLGGDALRLAVAALALVVSVPWLFAEAGFYAPDPILADEPSPDEPLAAVHLGSHHGTEGVVLLLTALALSRLVPAVRGPLAAWVSGTLALMLAYGTAIAAQDFWLEQVWKRGSTTVRLPDMVLPSLSYGWLAIVLGAIAVELAWFRRERTRAAAAADE